MSGLLTNRSFLNFHFSYLLKFFLLSAHVSRKLLGSLQFVEKAMYSLCFPAFCPLYMKKLFIFSEIADQPHIILTSTFTLLIIFGRMLAQMKVGIVTVGLIGFFLV